MKKVLWLSRHDMTANQKSSLGNCEVTKINVASLQNVHVPFQGYLNNSEEITGFAPFKTIINQFDVIAIVLPINLQQQVLSVAGDKPVIVAQTRREIVKVDGEEDKAIFHFDGWKQLVKIEVVLEDFLPLA